MYQLARRGAAVEDAGIGFLDDHDAGTLDAIVAGVHGGGHEVRKSHVGNEPSALFHAQQRLFTVCPFLNAQLPVQDAGINTHIGNRLRKAERSAQRLAVLSRSWRDCERHVAGALFCRTALMNRGQRQASGQAAGGGSGVNPREFERGQRQRQVLRASQVAALFGIHEYCGDARLIERIQQRGLFGGPLMGAAEPLGHESRHRTACHLTRGLHQHLQVVAVGKTPKNLAHVVVGQGAQRFGSYSRNRGGHAITSG